MGARPPSALVTDRRSAGVHLVGLIPGPKEPNHAELLPYLKLVTDELSKLFVDGVRINTARYPEGESLERLSRIAKEEHGTDIEDERIALKHFGIITRNRKDG